MPNKWHVGRPRTTFAVGGVDDRQRHRVVGRAVDDSPSRSWRLLRLNGRHLDSMAVDRHGTGHDPRLETICIASIGTIARHPFPNDVVRITRSTTTWSGGIPERISGSGREAFAGSLSQPNVLRARYDSRPACAARVVWSAV